MIAHLLYRIRRLRYPGSRQYWERRYARDGNSGSGSGGRLADYKATWLNGFVRENAVQSVLELGCGDGRQLRLAAYPSYAGLDIAPSAVQRCRQMFAGDSSKSFSVYDPDTFDPAGFQAQLAISLEVIFHLTEERLYRLYLHHLFSCATQWVVIFSSDQEDDTGGRYPHVKPRRFTPDVPPGWTLYEKVENPHRDISFSDFYIFKKICPPNP